MEILNTPIWLLDDLMTLQSAYSALETAMGNG
jgi:hypothetical protein